MIGTAPREDPVTVSVVAPNRGVDEDAPVVATQHRVRDSAARKQPQVTDLQPLQEGQGVAPGDLPSAHEGEIEQPRAPARRKMFFPEVGESQGDRTSVRQR